MSAPRSAAVPIIRRQALAPSAFVDEFIRQNQPVVVTDAMSSWPALRDWTPERFRERFGDEKVQIYDDLFFMVSARPLKDYLDRYILNVDVTQRSPKRTPYVRWYSRQDERNDFPWSDDVFDRISSDWSRPYFMPDRDLILPHTPADSRADPVTNLFPARGVFISACGARTRLHVDPWASDAVLCQAYGRKRFVLFPPQDVPALLRDGKLMDLQFDPSADTWTLPCAPFADDCLMPGEAIFIPAGWAHAFYSTTPSISVTWNFVHQASSERWAAYLAAGVPVSERRSLDFFHSGSVSPMVSPERTSLPG